VIFTFDGDAAGQNAAMRAFREDQRWASQSFVAVAPSGKDPCELRQAEGGAAVRALVEDAVPMFDFAVRTTIRRFDLDTAEGRVQAMRAAAPIVASIRDRALRPEYARVVAGLLGVDVEQVAAEVNRAGKVAPAQAYESATAREPSEASLEPTADELREALPRPDLRDPVVLVERQLLQVVLQLPSLLDPTDVAQIDASSFRAPAHRAVWEGVVEAGGVGQRTGSAWADAVAAAVSVAAGAVVAELAVAPLPVTPDRSTGLPSRRYASSLVVGLREAGLKRQEADALGQLRRLDSTPDADPEVRRELSIRLQAVQRELESIHQQQGA
jgi:DNA primase